MEIITPEQALFALYRSGFESGSVVVYNLPTPVGQAEKGAVFLITSPDRRVPEERMVVALDADGVPVIVDFLDD